MNAALFDDLPFCPITLPRDERRLLARLPDWDTVVEISEVDHPACRRLERRGLVQVLRHKADPIAMFQTWYAGRVVDAFIYPAPWRDA